MKKQSGGILSSIHEHLVAFVIAIFLVGGVTGIVFYRDSLFADISGATTENAPTVQLPLVYSVANGHIEISTTKQFNDVATLSFFVMFDAKNVIPQMDKIVSPYEYTYAPSMENMIQVTLVVNQTIPANTVLFTLPINGSIENVTITNASVLWQNKQYESLAIQKQ